MGMSWVLSHGYGYVNHISVFYPADRHPYPPLTNTTSGTMFGVHNTTLQRHRNTWWVMYQFTMSICGFEIQNVNPNKKVFYWRLLKYRLNTKSLLRRKGMDLDSYTCENYILQKEESNIHLFFKCNYVKRCWQKIGIAPRRASHQYTMMQNIKEQMKIQCRMEAIITIFYGASGKLVMGGSLKEHHPPRFAVCKCLKK